MRNFTNENATKFTVSFAFRAHVDVIKYRETLAFSYERADYTSDLKTIGSQLP